MEYGIWIHTKVCNRIAVWHENVSYKEIFITTIITIIISSGCA